MWNNEVFDLSKQLIFQTLESLNKTNYWVQKPELLTALKLTTEQENNYVLNMYLKRSKPVLLMDKALNSKTKFKMAKEFPILTAINY